MSAKIFYLCFFADIKESLAIIIFYSCYQVLRSLINPSQVFIFCHRFFINLFKLSWYFWDNGYFLFWVLSWMLRGVWNNLIMLWVLSCNLMEMDETGTLWWKREWLKCHKWWWRAQTFVRNHQDLARRWSGSHDLPDLRVPDSTSYYRLPSRWPNFTHFLFFFYFSFKIQPRFFLFPLPFGVRL